MNKDEAVSLVQKTFDKPFDKSQFTHFIKELFNDFDTDKSMIVNGSYIKDAFKDKIKSYERIGQYTDPNGVKIDVIVAELQKEHSLEHARTSQRNFAADYLKTRGDKEVGLFVYYSPSRPDWRFSFVKRDTKTIQKDDGKVGIRVDLVPAKRYSFLVGQNEPNHTAKKQLLPLLINEQKNPLSKDLEEAFTIEKVTKEFFEKYKQLFIQLNDSLEKIVKSDHKIKKDFEEKGVDVVSFSKKLMGQLVFLYFLQKKSWLGVDRNEEWGTGPKDFLRMLFNKDKRYGIDYKNFFNDVLEPLFYEALAVSQDNDYSSKFQCRIPFLNGGLFDPIQGYSWTKHDIYIPNELFSNKKDTNDEGTGILDIFDLYNFTIKEDEPLDKEVAVDPEMLGKVFENLLEVKDRKSKGAFYTPREIVHYMCQQSLINYLSTGLKDSVSQFDIENFIQHGELAVDNTGTGKYEGELPKTIKNQAKQIDELLQNIKVCDPAIGSGAFPVGMMLEIVKARNALNSCFENKKNRNLYEFKRHCIHESIYGVDIDASAVDIAKLRLWLSLVVDETDMKTIKPLPNLEYKIMQGNSLLEEFEEIKLFDEGFLVSNKNQLEEQNDSLANRKKDLESKITPFYIKNHRWLKNKKIERPIELLELEKELMSVQKKLEHIKNGSTEKLSTGSLFEQVSQAINKLAEYKKLQNRFFESAQKHEKKELKEKLDQLEWDLIETTLKEQNKISSLKKLEQYKKSRTKPFFLWKLNFAEVFQEKGGFDVVIGNPPYVQIKQISSEERRVFEKIYSWATGRFNLFYLFMERAKSLTCLNGISAYIVPDRILLNTQCDDLRLDLIKSQNIIEFISFADGIFEDAVVDSIIIIYQNKKCDKESIKVKNKILLENISKSPYKYIPISYFLNSPNSQFDLSYKLEDSNLFNKIKSVSVQLGEIAEIKDGIIQSKIADKLFLKEFIDKDSKKLLFGKNVSKYKIEFDNNWVNYKPEKMMQYELRKVKGGAPGLRMRESKIFERRKILTRQTADEIIAAYDTEDYYYANTLHGTTIKSQDFDPLYVLGILNSRLITWYYRSTTAEQGKVFAQIKIELLRLIPIRNISPQAQKPVIKLVSEIMNKANNPKAMVQLQKELDKMIYKIYELTLSEISIVEDSVN